MSRDVIGSTRVTRERELYETFARCIVKEAESDGDVVYRRIVVEGKKMMMTLKKTKEDREDYFKGIFFSLPPQRRSHYSVPFYTRPCINSSIFQIYHILVGREKNLCSLIFYFNNFFRKKCRTYGFTASQGLSYFDNVKKVFFFSKTRIFTEYCYI